MESIPGALRLLVRQMTWEADGILSMTLSLEDGAELPQWQPGAHVDVMLPNGLIRPYSLCGRPESRDDWKIAVLRELDGTGGSAYIHDFLRPGARLSVTGPRNNFPLVPAEHYLLIGGGIGITPLLPMTLELAARDADWHLLYGGRRRASMAFLKTVTALGERVVVAPEDECGLLDLARAIDATPEATAVFCCGPEPLIAAVESQCQVSGRDAPHVERFKASPIKAFEFDTSADEPFDIVLSRSGKRFTVPVGRTIVEVLNEARVFVPTSCIEGYCGVCETEVLSGVPDYRDDLTEEQRGQNVMRVCVGRSKTPELVIKL